MPSRRREGIQHLAANPGRRAGRPQGGGVRAGFLVGVRGTGWEREERGCRRAVQEHKGGRHDSSRRLSPREPVINAGGSAGRVPVLPLLPALTLLSWGACGECQMLG